MKKLLPILALILASVSARAQGYIITYSTNFYSVPLTAEGSNGVPFAAANSLPLLTVPDFLAYMALHDFSLTNGMFHAITASGSVTNLSVGVTNLPAGSSATVTNTGVTNGIAYFQIGIPGTGFDTNGLFVLPPLTITNATDSTFGHGAGVLCADSNYVYISVATNLWKRAALTAW